jgi:hypothetical protein
MLLISLFLIGELCHTSGFIDIPTAPAYDIPGMLGGGVSFSIPFSNDDPVPNDLNEPDPMDFTFTFHYGFAGRGEISLSMYTPSVYALSVAYLLKPEKGNSPAFFVGIDDISYSPYLSTIGSGDDVGFIEEKNYYSKNGGRPAELMSAYIGMQKTFSAAKLVMGLGRGRFVGYAPRSHIFNTDIFVLGEDYKTEEHSAWAFGLFMGGSLTFGPVELIVEMDGRDGNAGIKYNHPYFTFTTAITKCEHFWSPKPYSPRFTAGLETSNRPMLQAPRVGSIECVVRDVTTKQMQTGYVVDLKEMNKRYKAKGGTFAMSLPAGNYTITISKANYHDYIAKITVKPGVKSKLIFNLKKTEEAMRKDVAYLEKQKNIKAYFEQGKIYYSEGNLVEAQKSFNNVLSLDPDHKEARDYLSKIEPRRQELVAVYSAEARSREQAKDLTRALEYWQKVLALDPNNSDARQGIARVEQQIASAKKPTQPTKPTKPTQPQATAAQIETLYKKGVSYFTSEKYDEALKVFKQVLALNPNHAGAKDYRKRTEARLKVLKGGG